MTDQIVLPQCFGRHWDGTKNSVCLTECDPEYQRKCLHVFAMETLPGAIERLGSKSLNKLSIFTGCSPEAILIAMNYRNNWPQRRPIKTKPNPGEKASSPKEKTTVSKKMASAKPIRQKKQNKKISKFEKEVEKYNLPWGNGDSLEIKKGDNAFTLLVGDDKYCLMGKIKGKSDRRYFESLTDIAQYLTGKKRGVNGYRYFRAEIEQFEKNKEVK